jgi:hypothetical protein
MSEWPAFGRASSAPSKAWTFGGGGGADLGERAREAGAGFFLSRLSKISRSELPGLSTTLVPSSCARVERVTVRFCRIANAFCRVDEVGSFLDCIRAA